MQAYAQIKDRSLSIGKLRALGRRLDLPEGWRYRSRVLRRPLAVGANGEATIVQDELQNTYQLATTTRKPGARKRHKVDLHAKTKEVGASAAGINDRGTVTGTPFGKGSIDILVTLAGGKATGTFRMVFPKGSVTGTVDMPFTITGGEIDFRRHGPHHRRDRRLPRHHERRAEGPRPQHAGRAERRRDGHGLREVLGPKD